MVLGVETSNVDVRIIIDAGILLTLILGLARMMFIVGNRDRTLSQHTVDLKGLKEITDNLVELTAAHSTNHAVTIEKFRAIENRLAELEVTGSRRMRAQG